MINLKLVFRLVHVCRWTQVVRLVVQPGGLTSGFALHLVIIWLPILRRSKAGGPVLDLAGRS